MGYNFIRETQRLKQFRKSFFSILICISLIFSQGFKPAAFAEESGVPFAGFNQQNINMAASNWSTVEATMDSSTITMTGAESHAVYYINLSSISDSVDCGTLKIDFSTLATIANETAGELDAASASLSFRSSESGENLASYTLTRGTDNPGSAVAVTSNAAIPVGTRFIFIDLIGVKAGSVNTVVFSTPSLIINDQQDPTLSVSRNTDWTNQDVTVTLTATDLESGIAGIYDSLSSGLVSSGTEYQYTLTQNGTASFYTMDYAGRTSEAIEINVANIDKNAPSSAPEITVSKTGWANVPVTFTLSAPTAAAGESPETCQYRLNGGEWTAYSSTVTISSQGSTLIESRVADAAGNNSAIKSATVTVDTTAPAVDSLAADVHIAGGATVTFTASDSGSGIAEKRWAAGNQNASYFTSGGTILSGNTFEATAGGDYTVFAKDNAGNTTVSVININMYPSIAAISSQTLDEDTQKDVMFAVSDEETDAGDLLVSAVSSDTSLLPNPVCTNTDGNVRLVLAPAADKNGGPVTVTVNVQDGGGNSSTLQFTVMVNSINDTAAVTDDSIIIQEDNAAIIDVLANDSDLDADSLTIASVGSAAHGTVVAAADGLSVTYTPNANYNGSDSFTYTVTDGTQTSGTATVTIQVQEINDLPHAADDSLTINEDDAPLIDVLANDTDNDVGSTSDENLIIKSVTAPSWGTAVIQDNKVLYTPASNWSGTDSFSYTIEDRKGITSSATVKLTIRTANDAPAYLGLQDEYTVLEDSGEATIDFQISDVETDQSSLMLQSMSGNEALILDSSITLDGLGDADPATSLHFTPVANAYGDVTISLKLSDGFIVTLKTITIHIQPVNDSPVAHADSYSYTEDTSLLIDMDNLVSNDTDIEGNTLSFVAIASQPAYGSLVLVDAAAHTYRYIPQNNYSGNVTFTYTMTDGTDMATGVVTLRGTAVNDTPTVVLGASNVYTTDEDQTISGITFQISDIETAAGDLIVTAGTSDPDLVSADHIVVTKGSDGACTLSIGPNADQNGEATITLTVSDGKSLTIADFVLTINPVQDAPVAVDDYVSVAKNGSVEFEPLSNDYDVDGDSMSIVSFLQPLDATGTVSQSGNKLTFTDNSGTAGIKTFTYTITDGTVQSTATVHISIGGFSFPPKITSVADRYIDEDTQTADLAFSVWDPDVSDVLTVNAVSGNTTLLPADSAHIVLTKGTGGQYTVKLAPAANQYGSAEITLTVQDPSGNTASTHFILTVYPVNDIPIAADDIFNVDEDQTSVIDMLANDSDTETAGSDLKVVATTNPMHGRLTLSSGVYSYTPVLNYNGTDSFTYTMTDGETTVTAAVQLNVQAVNDQPRAYSKWVELPNTAGQTAAVTVLSGAYDLDGDTLYTDSIVSQPVYGDVVINADGTVTYTRNQASPLSNGADSFTFRIRDRVTAEGDVLYATATVYIGIDFVPSVWTEDVSVQANEDCAAFWIPLSIGNPNGNALTITTGDPSLGTITEIDSVNKRIKFQPDADANGTESFIYTVSDNVIEPVQTSTSRVYLTLYPVNDAPVFTEVPTDKTVAEDTATGLLAASFTDVDSSDILFDAYVVNSDPDNPVLLKNGISVSRTDNTVQLQLTPLANANGSATITLQASDGMLYTRQTFNLTVTPVNDAPQPENYTFTMKEDTSETFTVISPNSDVDGDALTVSIPAGKGPSHGSASVNADGTIAYTPVENYYGTDSFTYSLNDGSISAAGTVTVNVENLNDPPVINGLPYQSQTVEDTDIVLPFTVFDADGDTLTLTASSGNTGLIPDAGLSITGDTGNRTLTIHSADNQYGSAAITVTVDDGSETAQQTVAVTVSSVNDLPGAQNDAYTTNEDTAATLDVLANDTDVEDASLSIVAIGKPGHGSAEYSGGMVVYTPAANYYGSDTFSYTVSDSNDGHATATVTMDILPVNDRPNAAADSVTINEDTPVTISVLANDSDVEGNKLTVLSTSGGTLAQSITVNGDGTVTYVPSLNANGTDTFTYTISDGQAENNQNTGTVTVKILPFNDSPVIDSNTPDSDNWEMNEDEAGVFLFDVSDAETNVRNLIVTLHSSNQNLIADTSIALTGTGIVKTATIQPVSNANGACTIYITASDGVNTVVKIFNLAVHSVNDQPVLQVHNMTANEDTSVSSTATGSDVETGTPVFSLSTDVGDGPSHGTAAVQADGSYQYTPQANFNGTDSFVVVIDDGGGSANSVNRATVQVTVLPVNDPPVANDDTATTEEDTAVTVDILANDSDVDTDASLNTHPEYESVSVAADGFSGVENGTVSLSDGKVVFTPNANWNGTEAFTCTVRDVSGAEDTSTLTITVNPADDIPAVGNDTYVVTEDIAKVLDVLENDDVDTKTNPPLEELTITGITTQPTNGTAAIAADSKNITYTPAANYFGPDSIVYTMKDKAGHTGSFTVSITVDSVNDVPAISSIAEQTINEDETTGALSFTVDDVEDADASLTVTAVSSNTTLVPNTGAAIAIVNQGGQNRTIAVTPAANRSGSSNITVTVRDSNNATKTTTFTVTVAAVNDVPAAVADNYITNENTPVVLDVLTNDDVDLWLEGDTLHILSINDADETSLGTYTVFNDASDNNREKIRFTPNANWTSKTNGTEVLQYSMEDASHATSSSQVTVTITPVNDLPVLSTIADQTFDEDKAGGTGELSFTVSDEEDDDETIAITATSSNQTLIPDANITVLNPVSGDASDRTIQAVSAADANGEATITITATDGDGAVTTTTFKVTVNPVNDPSANGADIFTVIEDTATTLDVLANDDVDISTNPELETLTILRVDQAPLHGLATITESSTRILYTPAENNTQDDTFTYTMKTANNEERTYTVTIHMTPVNDAPDIHSSIADQTTQEGTATGVLSFTIDDVDDEGKNLAVSASSSNKVLVPDANITVTKEDSGNCTVKVTPYGKWNGTTTITLTVKDDDNASDEGSNATFKVIVQKVNEAPVAKNDLGYVSNEDTTVSLTVLANDTDADLATNPETETMTITSFAGVDNATVTITDSGKKLQFVPKANWNGTEEFTYTISDTAGLTSTATVRVKVNGRNDAPVAADDTGSTDEDTAVSIDALLNDSDIDKDVTLNTDPNVNPASESISLVTGGFAGVDNGTAAIADGKILFTPAANWNGVEEFTYTVRDVAGATDTGTVTITVVPVNDAPDAVNDSATVAEDSSVAVSVLANDIDADLSAANNHPMDESLAVSLDTLPGHGGLQLNGNKTITYTPNANWNGTDTFTYIITDTEGITDTATVTMTVSQVNDAPVAGDDTASTNEDTWVDIDALLNDTDTDKDAGLNSLPGAESLSVSASGFSGVDHGTASVVGGKIRFTPAANWNGEETFNYTVRDAAGATDTGSITVTVAQVNDTPAGVADDLSTQEDTTAILDVLANDTDIDKNAALNKTPGAENLTIKEDGFLQVDHGTVSIVDGKIQYVPQANFNGTDVFLYTVRDNSGAEATGTVTLHITQVNDAPLGTDDTSETNEDTSVLIDALANDSDIDKDSLLNVNYNAESLALVSNGFSGVEYGSAAVEDGKIRFTPAANWNGTETFTYTLRDVTGAVDTADVTVTVKGKNDLPVAGDDTAQTNEEAAVTIDVLTNDTDIDKDVQLNNDPDANPANESLSVASGGFSGVDHGTVQIVEGKVLFTPASNWNGTESFDYIVEDAAHSTDTGSVTVTVLQVNDAPQANDDSALTGEDAAVTIDVLANDTDTDRTAALNANPSAESLSVVAGGFSGVEHGTAEIVDNKVVFTPANNWNGTETFTYTVQDVALAQSTATVTVTVTGVNDGPDALNDTASVDEDANVLIDVLVNDTDVDRDILLNNDPGADPDLETATIATGSILGVDNGTAVIENGKIRFTPAADWNGTEIFSYTMQDTAGVTDTAYVTVTVGQVNDKPVAQDDTATVGEDSSATINVTDNDWDEDTSASNNHPMEEVLAVSVAGGPAHGTAVANANNTITYTPAANWNGTDSFTYILKDADNEQDTATVTVTVTQANDKPVAAPDTATMDEDASQLIDVLANDSDTDTDSSLNADPDAEILSLLSGGITGVDNGIAAVENGKIRFTPTSNWNGSETFTYTMRDAAGQTSSASVTVTVNQKNDIPSAASDSFNFEEEETAILDVLENDTDIDMNASLNASPGLESLSIKPDGFTQVDHGTVSIVDGKIQYVPEHNFNGVEVFLYTLCDAAGEESTGTVTLTITQVNDAPDAVGDTAETDEDAAALIDVLGNDTDTDKDLLLNLTPGAESLSLAAGGISGLDNGTAAMMDGKIQFTPDANWNGIETFTYTVKDVSGATDTATVTVKVKQVNDPPEAQDDTAITSEDVPVLIDALSNDADIDIDPANNLDEDAVKESLSIAADGFSGVDNGTATVENGKIKFIPASDWNGTEIFSYTVKDRAGQTDTAEVTVTVSSQNNAPSANGDVAETNEDAPVTVDVLANDLDVDAALEGDNLTIVSTSDVDHGDAVIAPDNKSIQFTPDADWNGTEVFTYTIRDKGDLRSSATVSITVKAVNDAPSALDDTAETDEDNAVTVKVLANDTDVDLLLGGDSLTILSVAGVDNGNVVIAPDKKTLTFVPNANWNGEEVFTYVMKDIAGMQSSAAVHLTVHAVNDAPTAPTLLTPKAGEAYKDNQTVSVTWTVSADVENSAVTYTLFFYNGTSWSELATGLTDTKYSHLLNTGITTNAAQYKVTATDGMLVTSDTGDKYIIDNQAPQSVTAMAQSGGSAIDEGVWSRQAVTFILANGKDILPFTYSYSLDNQTWTTVEEGQQTIFSDNGTYTVYYRAVDALGNTYLGSRVIRIDMLSPAEPGIGYSTTAPTNKSVAITLSLGDDPGGSGNSYVVLPDGSTAAAQSSVSWSASANGQYSFVLYDIAGNSLTVPATVSNIDRTAPIISVNNNGYKFGKISNKMLNALLSFSDVGSGIASKTYSLAEGKDGGSAVEYTGTIEIREDGSYYIHAYARDRAGNQTEAVFGPYVLDTTPPELAYEISNLSVAGGKIAINFSNDITGVVRVYYPDGTVQEFSAEGFDFIATISGDYVIEVEDEAGNITKQTVTVTLPDEETPAAVPELEGASVTAQAQIAGPAVYYWIAAAIALILLLLLLIWMRRPVRIEYLGMDADGKEVRKVKKRFAHAPKKDGLLSIDITPNYQNILMHTVTVTFVRSFTKKMRERNVLLLLQGIELNRNYIPEDQEGQWSSETQLKETE